MHEASPERVKRFYSITANEYTARYYDDLSDVSIVDELIEVLPQNASVLDVGCGPGTFTRYLSSKGIAVEGIDLSAAMIAKATERLPQLSFSEMDMRTLKYEDASLDAILSAYSLIHIPDDEVPVVLREFRRVLRPDGHLLVIGQLGEPDHVEDEPLAPGHQVFVNFFTRDRLRSHLERAGFQIVTLSTKSIEDTAAMSDGVLSALGRRNL